MDDPKGGDWREMGIEKSVARLRKSSLNNAHNTQQQSTNHHDHVTVRKMCFAAQSRANGGIFHGIVTAILSVYY